jgi:UDP-N-acetylmuramate dehydrogenase
MQNIGAYGVEVKDVFHSLEAIHIHEKAKRVFNASECSFGYRDSVFKQKEKNKWVITSVSFRLKKHPEFHTGYGAIQDELDKMNLDKMSIRAVSQAVIAIRKSKLPDPKKLGNAGSFFKNPVVPLAVYEAVNENHSDAPCYPIDAENVKVPAGWLIEKAGWKGKQIGQYGVHDKQALVIVNFGGATGNELFELSTHIIGDVQEKFGIHLEREVNIY